MPVCKQFSRAITIGIYMPTKCVVSVVMVSFVTVAGVLWLFLDSNVTPLAVMASLCQLRGPMAIERVKVCEVLMIVFSI